MNIARNNAHPSAPSPNPTLMLQLHFQLCSIAHVATKVQVILWQYIVLTWGCKYGKVDQKSSPSFFGQRPKSSSEVLFKFDFFYDDLYCCFKYSYIEYQVEVFKIYH